MGDISELRGLVFCVSFLGLLVLLYLWMPAQLFTSEEYRDVEVPDIFEGIDVYSFADTDTFTMNETGGFDPPLESSYYVYELDDGDGYFGGHDIDFWYKDANESDHFVKNQHLYSVFLIILVHDMNFYDHNGVNLGTLLNVSDIEDNSLDNYTSRFNVKCEHLSYTAIFAYNATLYGNFTHAWDYHGLNVFCGISFDQVSTSYNAFDLIGKLLFWQLPEVETHVNAIISLPIWASICYLVYIFILRTIGAIFGGGA